MNRERWAGIALLVVGCSSHEAGCGLGGGCTGVTADEATPEDATVSLTSATIDTAPGAPASAATAQTSAPAATSPPDPSLGATADESAPPSTAQGPAPRRAPATTTAPATTGNVATAPSLAPLPLPQLIAPQVEVNVEIVTDERGGVVDAGASATTDVGSGTSPAVIVVTSADASAVPSAVPSASAAPSASARPTPIPSPNAGP